MSVADVAAAASLDEEALTQFEGMGTGLGAYDLARLADVFDTRLGVWIYDDQNALPRGTDPDAAKAATELGVELMDEYLAAETLAG